MLRTILIPGRRKPGPYEDPQVVVILLKLVDSFQIVNLVLDADPNVDILIKVLRQYCLFTFHTFFTQFL